MRRAAVWIEVVGVFAWALVAAGQAARVDRVSGRVVGPDSAAVRDAAVLVMDTVARSTAAGRTGSDGRYAVEVPNGSGHYLVRVQAPTFRVTQRFLTRTEAPSSLVADFKLELAPQQIATMRVEARRARPPRESVFGEDVAGGQFFGGRTPVPADAADLASWAASTPGVSLITGADGGPPGFSVLGLGSGQNNMTMQGMQIGPVDIPRAGGAFPIMATNSSDPSRGGFSGGLAQLFVPGGSNFRQFNVVVNVEDPALQVSDRVASRLGTEFRNLLLSGSVQGPIREDHIYFNTSFQVTRRTSDLATLLGLDNAGLQQIGLARDSLARFQQLVNAAGVPLTVTGAGTQRVSDAATFIGRFDLSPTGTTAANLVTTVTLGRSRGMGIGPSSPVAAGGESRNSAASAVYTWSRYVRQAFLQEFKVATSWSRRASEPWLFLPTARVRVTSALPDGTSGVSNLPFGGNAGLNDESTNGSWELQSNTSWISKDTKHRVKLASSLQYAWLEQESRTNLLGTWGYNSLADLASGIPSSFTRNLTPRLRNGAAYNWFVSIGDMWRASNAMAIQGGVRLEGNHFAKLPLLNPEVQQVFGVRTDRGPNRIHLSPRLGFRRTFGLPAPGTNAGFFFNETGIWSIRANIGEYRNMLPATLLSQAFDGTGLPSGWRQLSCYGAAIPTPEWDAGALPPDRCLDGTGGTALIDAQPPVFSYSPDFDASRSWRGNFGVDKVLGPLRTSLDATWSVNLDQRSSLDYNFAGVQRFTLPDENGRPVYADIAGIDPRTGAVSPRSSRSVDTYGAVNVQSSDLRSSSRQLMVTFQPLRFNQWYSWVVTWANTATRGGQRGFGGSGIGDPRLIEWGPLSAPRHQITTTFRFQAQWSPIRATITHQLSSGQPFTPVVGGDVNGDGVGGDRAFIAGNGRGDPAVAASIDQLAAAAPSYVRDCLRSQSGAFAGINSCRGPWTQQMGLIVNPMQGRFGIPRRMFVTLTAWNPLGGLDQLINGSELRGWGQNTFGDPTLLYVRGFDAQRQRYVYEVNPRFGDARPSRSAFRSPFRLAIEARINLAPMADRQQLARELSLGRTRKGTRSVSERFKQIYARIPFSVVPGLIQSKDSLMLTNEQVDTLNAIHKRAQDRYDILWAPTADWLGSLGDRYDLNDALARVRDTRKRSGPLAIEYINAVRKILRDEQMLRLPQFIRGWFEPSIQKQILEGGGEFFFAF